MNCAPTSISVTSFWGKAGDGDVVHSAMCHMIDVGAVARTFLCECAPRRLMEFLAEPFGGQQEAMVHVLPLLAAMHDLGKISPGFQYKRPDLAAPLVAAGLPFSLADTTDHGEVAFEFLKKVGLRELGIEARGTRYRLAAVLAAHHGSFPRDAVVDHVRADERLQLHRHAEPVRRRPRRPEGRDRVPVRHRRPESWLWFRSWG